MNSGVENIDTRYECFHLLICNSHSTVPHFWISVNVFVNVFNYIISTFTEFVICHFLIFEATFACVIYLIFNQLESIMRYIVIKINILIKISISDYLLWVSYLIEVIISFRFQWTCIFGGVGILVSKYLPLPFRRVRMKI